MDMLSTCQATYECSVVTVDIENVSGVDESLHKICGRVVGTWCIKQPKFASASVTIQLQDGAHFISRKAGSNSHVIPMVSNNASISHEPVMMMFSSSNRTTISWRFQWLLVDGRLRIGDRSGQPRRGARGARGGCVNPPAEGFGSRSGRPTVPSPRGVELRA